MIKRLILILLFFNGVVFNAASDPYSPELIQSISENLNSIQTYVFAPEKNCEDPEQISKPGCLALVEDFCETLYNPDNQGNLSLPANEDSLIVSHGNTKNGFDYAFYNYSLAKIKYQDNLPEDFLNELKKRNYFTLLNSYLKSKSDDELSLEESLIKLEQSSEVAIIWQLSQQIIIARRLADPESAGESRDKVTDVFNAEIYQGIWKNHPSALKVREQFEILKAGYIAEVTSNTKISESLRAKWLEKIQSLTLNIPGDKPQGLDLECATTNTNAFYDATDNTVIICAGDFLSEDVLQSLAHEMGHTLDPAVMLIDSNNESKIAQRLKQLKQNSCNDGKIDCEAWTKAKENFDKEALELSNFQNEIPENFLSCLQKRDIDQVLTTEQKGLIAKSYIDWWADNYGKSDKYLHLITEEIQNSDGSLTPNPMYLNVCGSYTWENYTYLYNVDDSYPLLYVTSFACSNAEGREAKMDSAIQEAMHYTEILKKNTIGQLGVYSDDATLVNTGYAESVGEQFADYIGEKVLAKILQELPLEDRRNTFLSSISWLCTPKTVAERYPELAIIQQKYSPKVHSIMQVRRKEVLTQPIIEALSCKKDFFQVECEL